MLPDRKGHTVDMDSGNNSSLAVGLSLNLAELRVTTSKSPTKPEQLLLSLCVTSLHTQSQGAHLPVEVSPGVPGGWAWAHCFRMAEPGRLSTLSLLFSPWNASHSIAAPALSSAGVFLRDGMPQSFFSVLSKGGPSFLGPVMLPRNIYQLLFPLL